MPDRFKDYENIKLSGDEKTIIETFAYDTFKKTSDQYGDEKTIQYIIAAIIGVPVLVGLKVQFNIDNPEDQAFLKNMAKSILHHHQGLNIKDIKEAFNFNALGVFKDGIIDNYNSFSLVFVLKVLKSYIEYKNSIMKSIKLKIPDKEETKLSESEKE